LFIETHSARPLTERGSLPGPTCRNNKLV